MNKLPSYNDLKNKLSSSEKIGQLFMPAAFINDTEEEIQKIELLIKEYGIGSLCFFHSRASAATNYEGKKEVIFNAESLKTLKSLIRRYQKIAKYPLLMAIDAEWGLAMRIENTPQYPYAITLGAIQGKDNLSYEVGKNIAVDCKAAGIHWNLAPCVDINDNPNNPVIGYRSFGEDKIKVAEKSLAFVKGTQSEGILTSIKHFPGHGDTEIDSHLGLPLITKSKKELLANELYPFQKLIDEGVDSVMVGHLSVPSLANGSKVPSSLSKEMIKGLLRSEMDFKGVVISDALNMRAISKKHPEKGEIEWLAFDAGNDVLCFAENVPEAIEKILNKSNKEQIEESFERVWQLKEKALQAEYEKLNSNSKTVSDEELQRRLAESSLTLIKGNEESLSLFRNSDYCTLTIKRSKYDLNNTRILKSLEETKQIVKEENHVLILLTPPQVKPVNNFGLLNEEIDFINQLIKTKSVVLYLFGNPYVLNRLNIENTTATVTLYQDFKVFQDVATEHFLGKLTAQGELPITVN